MTISTSEITEGLTRAEAEIRAAATALGFDACRFTTIRETWPAAAKLAEFIGAGRHGDMGWLAETAERRAHPRAMWADAR